MSATFNLAVKQDWDRTADATRDRLAKQMKDGLGPDADLNGWVRQMAEQNVDMVYLRSLKSGGTRVGAAKAAGKRKLKNQGK